MPPQIKWENRRLLLDQTQLVPIEETYLTADAAVGTSLTVANINRFGVNQNLILNPFGETAEFVKTATSSATTSPATVTLAATTVYAHYTGEKVFIVLFDTVELARAATLTGTKTALTTTTGNGLVSLEADNERLVYSEVEYNSGYYFARYVNDIGATFTISGDTLTSTAHGLVNGDTVKLIAATTIPTGLSTTVVYYVVEKDTNTFKVSLTNGGSAVTASDSGAGTLTWYRCSLYSDGVQYGTWDRSSVGFMIERALADLGISLSEKVTLQDCYEWLTAGLRLTQGKLKRWPEHYSYNAVLGQVTRGTNVQTMPTDAYDTETNRSLIALRTGDNRNMRYLDPVLFDAQLEGVSVTQVTTAASAAQTTLAIDNSYDFDDSGTVVVYVSGTKYSITYTGVTRSATAGVLTGVPASGTGSITVTIPADTYVWQGEEEGVPEFFTVRNGQIEFWPLADANEDNVNMYGDYSHVATAINSDGDTIDVHRYDMVQYYLTWRIEQKVKSDNKLDTTSGWYIQFKEALYDAIKTLPSNLRFPMRPNVNRMQKRGFTSFKANLQDLSISDQ